jgi:hypothetical protein
MTVDRKAVEARIAELWADEDRVPSLRGFEESTADLLEGLVREVQSVREVADPDNETPELSLRDRVMHVGEQAALLVSVNRMCERRGAERNAARAEVARLTAENDRLRPVVEAAERVRDKRREVSKGMRRHEELKTELHDLSESVDTYRASKEPT